MLNIPAEVIPLFKRDDIFKNFHVQFPNGENADLNNEDVLSESVSFTESLCSQQAFRFGLTESSEIRFTCVNVPNVRGAVIECAIEICVEELGAAWIAAHAPSGTEEFLDLQECTYDGQTMYRIPYGRFIIDTCPRNHEAMYKREVVAYTKRMEDAVNTNPYQTAVLNSFYTTNTYTVRVKPLVYAVLHNDSPDDLLSLGYTKTIIPRDILVAHDIISLNLKTTGGVTKLVAFDTTRYAHLDTSITGTEIYAADWSSSTISDMIERVADALDTMGIDAAQSGYASLEDIAYEGLKHQTGNSSYVIPGSVRTYIPYGTGLMYPYIGGTTQIGFNEPTQTKIEASGLTTQTVTYGSTNFYKYTDTNPTDAMATAEISVTSTLETEREVQGVVSTYYSFANAVSIPAIIKGYLELFCQFGAPDRNGGIQFVPLDDSSPISILPSEYAELWYDETQIAPIGYVSVKFKGDNGNEQDITVQIGLGASVYDMTSNVILQNMVFSVSSAEAALGVTIESKIIDFLNAVFVSNLPNLSFIPIELEKKGLPYLEAGDAVEVTTEDSQTVPSFILRQTITGIQYLSADVESANGEAMEII